MLTALAELTRRSLLATGSGDSAPGAGRPGGTGPVEPRCGLTVGVEIGRRHVQVVLADLGHQEIDKTPARTDAYRHLPSADAHPDQVLDKAAELVRTLLDRNGAALDQVTGIGLGIPAPMTHDGHFGSPTLLPEWAGIAPAPALASRLDGAPVLVDNDANLGALGEYLFGGFRNEHHAAESYEMVYVKVATGIGAGIIRDGRIWRGAGGTDRTRAHYAGPCQSGALPVRQPRMPRAPRRRGGATQEGPGRMA